jgi:hypothetical protein
MTTDLAELQVLAQEPIAEDSTPCIPAADAELRPTFTTVC